MNHLFCMSCSSDQKVVTGSSGVSRVSGVQPCRRPVGEICGEICGKIVGKCGENHVAKIDFHITSFF